MTDQNRIAALEAENQRLRARMAAAGIPLAPTVPLPSDDQADTLLDMIANCFQFEVERGGKPRIEFPLRCRDDDREPYIEHRAAFRHALLYFAFAQRSDKFSRYGIVALLDRSREWLRARGVPFGECPTLKSFYCAAIASGVSYAAPTANFPHDLEIALLDGGTDNRPQPLAWHSILTSRTLPAPSESTRRVVRPTNETNILRAGYTPMVRSE